MSQFKLAASLIAVMFSAFMVSLFAGDATSPSSVLARLTKSVARDDIGGIETIRIPDTIRGFSQIGPPEIEAQWLYRFSDRRISSEQGKQLGAILRDVKIRRTETGWDLRWGIVFYSRSGDRIAALYFDKTGRYGSIGDVPVAYQSEVFAQIRKVFPTSIQ